MNTEELIQRLRAGYACIYIVTHEETRATNLLLEVAVKMKYAAWTWTCTKGLVSAEGKALDKTADVLAALDKVEEHDIKKTKEGGHEFVGKKDQIENKSIIIFKDLHLFLKSPPPPLIRRLKEAIKIGRATNRHIIIIGSQLHLPPDLEKEITEFSLPLPSREEIIGIASAIADAEGCKLNGETDAVGDAGSGLTHQEMEDASAYSVIAANKIDPVLINRSKTMTIGKSGILEVLEPGVTFNEMGGCGELKNWVSKRKRAFTPEAKTYGLPTPKGIILFGVQGSGKTYSTRAIAGELKWPLLRLDAGKLFSSLVGSSEQNVRAVIAQVEAFGQCILFIDELDKGFAGMTGGHDADSGTTRRVIGTFLTWMSDKKSPVFIVATANDLTRLPPELLRKGRWDELFFVDLPTHDERVEIWRVQIKKQSRDPKKFDLTELASITDAWTGAEIEALFSEGLYDAFDRNTEPDTETLVRLSSQTVPLSKTMGESISELRKWATGRAKSASLPVTATKTNTGTVARKLGKA